ncbi:MAG: glycosyltransferase [Halioglobus sp.]
MAEPPLVAHIIYSLSTGGLENGLVNILNRFPAGRYRHAIICITSADDFSRRITAPDVQLFQMHKREGHDLGFYLRLWRLLRQLRPDIVHSRNLAALEAQVCTLGLWRTRRVHGEHGREIGDVDGSNRKYLMLRRIMRLLIHSYIAVSRDLQQWLINSVGVDERRVTQIYNGVDHQRFHPGTVKPLAILPQRWLEHSDIVIAGTVGRLTPVKDQQTLLRAVAALREQDVTLGKRLRLILVGDGPLREELLELAATLGLGDAVWFAGDRSDVPELLQAMDVFVLPSLGEGISNTVLEAMACGLPVIATAVGGNLELVRDGDNGALVPVGDPDALATRLGELLNDEDRRARAANNALQFVQDHFHWENTVHKYQDVYDNLLDRSAGSAAGGA